MEPPITAVQPSLYRGPWSPSSTQIQINTVVTVIIILVVAIVSVVAIVFAAFLLLLLSAPQVSDIYMYYLTTLPLISSLKKPH